MRYTVTDGETERTVEGAHGGVWQMTVSGCMVRQYTARAKR